MTEAVEFSPWISNFQGEYDRIPASQGKERTQGDDGVLGHLLVVVVRQAAQHVHGGHRGVADAQQGHSQRHGPPAHMYGNCR